MKRTDLKRGAELLTCYSPRELRTPQIGVKMVAPGPIAADFSAGLVRDNPGMNKRVGEITALTGRTRYSTPRKKRVIAGCTSRPARKELS